jgi:two-component system, cell cycle sensor histidine kinase and response regulator CckA
LWSRSCGTKVTASSKHAAAALELWKAHAEEVDLLLTDIVMPGEMSGVDLARELLARKPKLKVIYTSGYSAELLASDIALEDGINYLPKPYLSSKLVAMVHAALEGDRTSSSSS